MDGAVVLQMRFGNCDKEILLPYSLKERDFAQWGPSLSGQTRKHAVGHWICNIYLAAIVVLSAICPLFDGPFVFVITLLKPDHRVCRKMVNRHCVKTTTTVVNPSAEQTRQCEQIRGHHEFSSTSGEPLTGLPLVLWPTPSPSWRLNVRSFYANIIERGVAFNTRGLLLHMPVLNLHRGRMLAKVVEEEFL